ncbi:hypothetical protein [Streptomyces sp. NPDC094149]|uniref:hypothetical protein n=1 Tax=Streptomyces sp. NPDC094149 TaxID=3155079 RepID=UPI00333463A3
MIVTALLLPVVLLLILFGLDAWESLLFHHDSDPPPEQPWRQSQASGSPHQR